MKKKTKQTTKISLATEENNKPVTKIIPNKYKSSLVIRCDVHPTYTGQKRPIADCPCCRYVHMLKQPKKPYGS